MSKLGSVIILMGCLGLISPALAAQDSAKTYAMPLQQMQTLDTNKDGVIDKQEFAKRNADAAAFSALDVNKDGVLDQAEQRSGVKLMPMRVR